MSGWHFHWSLAPVLLLVGVLIGVVFAPPGSGPAVAAAPAAEAMATAEADFAAEPAAVDAAAEVRRDAERAAQIEAGADRAHASAQLEAFRRQNYEDCVAADLIGDNCRIIFYPETPAEKAQSEEWARAARPQVEAQTRWLSEYNERQIRERSR